MTAAGVQICEACGTTVLPGDHFCEECGARVSDADIELPHVPSGRTELDLTIAAGVSDQGRVHRRNEDAFHLELVGDAIVAVVCDGISTASSGDVASRWAAQAAGAVLADAVRNGATDLHAASDDAVAAARDAVTGVPATVRSDIPVPSCTLVSAVCRNGEIVVGWLGDSRAYWLAAGDNRQLTTDDSWAGEQVAAGLMSAHEAAQDRRSHAITRWIGSDTPDWAPQVVALDVDAPGRLVLCTDGVWNYVDEADALAELVAALPPESGAAAVARNLAEFALQRGGRDNITAVVVDLAPPGEG